MTANQSRAVFSQIGQSTFGKFEIFRTKQKPIHLSSSKPKRFQRPPTMGTNKGAHGLSDDSDILWLNVDHSFWLSIDKPSKKYDSRGRNIEFEIVVDLTAKRRESFPMVGSL